MNPMRTCPQCGAALDAEASEGLCPACLMKAGLATRGSATRAGEPMIEPLQTQTLNPAAGTKVRYFGDYELLEEIARGGMGVVWKARQVSLNRVVALKMIRSGELASEAEVKRFRVEAEAAANLQHPNIVAIHEVGMHDGRHYFTMDFVEGRNLAQVAGGRPMAAQRAARYVKTLAEAVHFAHQRGTLHRDLKPQNVLVDARDHVRITDFGLARQTQRDSSLTESGVAMGSPSYMPPEQAQGRRDLIGPASDVYSLGALLYELLTGRAPFLGDTPMATMMKVVEQEPDAPSKLEPNVPRDLETICLKCLEKSPDRRYPSARALAEELERFLNNEPILARPASALRKAVNWSRRHRHVMTAVVSAAVLGLTGLAYGLWQQTEFLTWLNAHPGHVKAVGPRTAALRTGYGSFAFVLLICALTLYRKLSRRLSWRELFDPANFFTPACPIQAGWAVVFGAIGAAGIGGSLYYSARLIEALVWEGTFPWPVLVAVVYPAFYFGLLLLTMVIREQAGEAIGWQSPVGAAALPPERSAAIHAALFAGRQDEALRLYREATGAGPRDAKAQVGLLAARLYRAHPEKFAADPTLPPAVCLPRLAALTLGGAALLAIAVLFMPASLLPSWPADCAAGAVGGVILMGTLRFRKFWQRFLGVLPLLLMSMAAQAFTQANNPGMDSSLPVLIGLFAGAALVAAARKKPLSRAAGPAAAGLAGAASHAPAAASASGVGVLGAILGPVIGLAGAFFGAKASIENTRSPRERRFMVRMTWCAAAGVVIFCAALFALTFWGRTLLETHPGWFAATLAALLVAYGAALAGFILQVNRRQRQIQIEESNKTRTKN